MGTSALDPSLFKYGGGILFSGGTGVRKAGLIGATLSWAIEKITRSRFSHWATVPPAEYWPDDKPWIIESTIWKGISGPQYNDLGSRLDDDYAAEGGHAVFLGFLRQFTPEWEELWAAAEHMFALQKAGKLHYSVKRLFADATARNPFFAVLPTAGIIDLLAEKDDGIVCSECGGLLLQAGCVDAIVKAAGIPWLPRVLPIPGQVLGCAPEDLYEMPIWAPAITIL